MDFVNAISENVLELKEGLQCHSPAKYFVNIEPVVVMAGYGRSGKAYFTKKRDFMEQFVKAVKLGRPVLVAASMSGSFALPFVFRPDAATCTQRVRGFVPIAPAAASKFTQADYKSCKVRFPRDIFSPRTFSPTGLFPLFFYMM